MDASGKMDANEYVSEEALDTAMITASLAGGKGFTIAAKPSDTIHDLMPQMLDSLELNTDDHIQLTDGDEIFSESATASKIEGRDLSIVRIFPDAWCRGKCFARYESCAFGGGSSRDSWKLVLHEDGSCSYEHNDSFCDTMDSTTTSSGKHLRGTWAYDQKEGKVTIQGELKKGRQNSDCEGSSESMSFTKDDLNNKWRVSKA